MGGNVSVTLRASCLSSGILVLSKLVHTETNFKRVSTFTILLRYKIRYTLPSDKTLSCFSPKRAQGELVRAYVHTAYVWEDGCIGQGGDISRGFSGAIKLLTQLIENCNDDALRLSHLYWYVLHSCVLA